MIRFSLVAAMMLSATPALADRVNDGFVGCVTESALDEFITAAVNDDNRQMQALLGSACIPIGGLEYSMVDRGFMTSEIRVYGGGQSALVFTSAEATQ